MNIHEIAWLAGYLEGEGCFQTHYVNKKRGTKQFRVVAASTDKDVIYYVQELTGVGRVYERNKTRYNPRHRTAYVWDVGRRDEVGHLMRLILPYMHSRRSAKIRALLDEIEEYEKTPGRYTHNEAKAARGEQPIPIL